MIRKTLPVVFALGLLAWVPALRAQDVPPDTLFSQDQLDNLVAPIALYPDPLLAASPKSKPLRLILPTAHS